MIFRFVCDDMPSQSFKKKDGGIFYDFYDL